MPDASFAEDTAPRHLADLERWRTLLDACAEIVFVDMVAGARIGVIRRTTAEDQAGPMAVSAANGRGMGAEMTDFSGYANSSVDLLFVPTDDALGMMHTAEPDDFFRTTRIAVRKGGILFFAMKRGRELRALGYSEFLDSLGLAYLGACR